MFKRIRLAHVVLSLLFNCSGNKQGAEERKLQPLEPSRAFSHVRQLVEFGPRSVGSEGHRKARDYIQSELKKLPLNLEVQSFDAITPKGTFKMHNIVARQRSGGQPVIILASHYDTVLTDRFPFVGANDGGSSTGLLLDLARVLASRESGFQYWFIFFDGEEAIQEWSDLDSLYGSRQFVKEMKALSQLPRIKAFVLLDMVGDKDLNIKRDLYSTPWLVDLFWATAAKWKYSGFDSATLGIMDDHSPFLEEGIPAVDLIDLDFGPSNSFWHSPGDTLDKVSVESLRQVGEVVLKTLPALERTIQEREGKR